MDVSESVKEVEDLFDKKPSQSWDASQSRDSSRRETTSMWQDLGTWRFIAIVVAVLLVVSIFSNGFSFGATGAAVANPLSLDDASDKALAFVNSNLLPPGMSATVGEKKDVGDLYQVQLSVQGQIVDSYITKDGRLLFPQGIDLTAVVPAPAGTNTQQLQKVDVSSDDDAVKGDKNAPVTIIEFSDFQCPFCSRFYTDTLPELDEKYIKTGKAKLIYRDFPLENIHPEARPSAEAAECAHEQGKYYEFHDKLFENQQQLSVANYKKWARELGLDGDKFDDCVDTNKYADEVSKDLADGSAAGVTGTPAFFVNGKLLSGAQPFTAFEALIEAELADGGNDGGSEVTAAAVVDTSPSAPSGSTKKFTLVAKKYRFTPTELRVSVGDTVQLAVKSDDVDFGFALEAFGVDEQLTSGQMTNVEFVADQEGEFWFTCSNCDGKEDIMKGKLVVE
ncbi:MAG TPA: thioredoxin domain-containing protein [Candidatus Nanoarchaeia archaeon]|nr:thioredoxin domain-containing protein [Candidatus Nanoarchaeia archaeon]